MEEAESYLRKAHEIAVAQFPETKYPRGHDELAQSWCDLGRVAQARGDLDQARGLFEQALHSYEDRLGQAFPQGHPSIARTLADLGRVRWSEGDYPAAKRYFQESLDMRKRLYPTDAFPAGHPLLANALRDLGGVCVDAGEHDEAYRLFKQAARMDYEVVASFFGSGSEAELLNLVARRFQSLDLVLNAWRHTDVPATDVYPFVWMRRGLVPRLFACRQRAIQESLENADSAEYTRYVASRRALSRSLFVSVGSDSARTSVQLGKLHELNAQKEDLERKLAGRIGTSSREAIEQFPRYESLVETLPENSVVIDLVRCVRFKAGKDLFAQGLQDRDAGFTAFILARKRGLACVDLGDAAEIEELAVTWQQELASDRPGDAGQRLVRLLWEPLHVHFPAATQVVYVVPDGALCGIPWGALPRPADSGVLLEDYAFAILPNAQLLLQQLGQCTPGDNRFQRVLAVGAVDYGTLDAEDANPAMGLKRVQWLPLEGSRTELATTVSAAAGRHITLLSGNEATVEKVLDHLPEVDCAHLATHGFYVDEQFGSTLKLAAIDHGSHSLEKNRNRATVLRRNPLVRSGLALAGANQLGGADELGVPREPVGILTADDIATRNCEDLKLVVLSACETGLGDVANADGTLGLQAAFHMAGARNVIASLWKIDDEATAEIMADFYRLLWQENRTPLEALREAQLTFLRRLKPTQTGDSRGPDLSTVVPLKSNNAATRTPGAYHWASFVLSGPGF
ncbi:MAG: CHAT domain-containing protein [Planctomycetes bacterium]|nr:CHAT domain-containing protein [Planctomycetota bacterium]